MKIATIILTLLSIAWLVLYTCLTIKKLGIPKSLSATYYLLKPYKKEKLFQATLIGMGILLLPAWINLSPDWWMFLAFLSCGSIMFVGAAAKYLRMEEKHVHVICAWVAGVASIAWSCLAYKLLWIVPLVCMVAALVGAIVDKKHHTFWIEMGAFVSTFISLIVALFIVY